LQLHHTLKKGGNKHPHKWQTEGERPESWILAMGSRVPA